MSRIGVALFASLLFLGCRPYGKPEDQSMVLPKYWQVPEFSLIDQEDSSFGRAAMSGTVWVVDFFYSSCPGPCPMLSNRLREIHGLLGAQKGVGLLSITSDPERDTPVVLRRYAEKFGANERWRFLTGEKAVVHRLANDGFKLSLQETPGADEPVTHSTRIVLVDRNGWIRGFYEGVGEGSDAATVRLLRDVNYLVKEAP